MKHYTLEQLQQRRVHLSMVVNADMYKLTRVEMPNYKRRYVNICKLIRAMMIAKVQADIKEACRQRALLNYQTF